MFVRLPPCWGTHPPAQAALGRQRSALHTRAARSWTASASEAETLGPTDEAKIQGGHRLHRVASEASPAQTVRRRSVQREFQPPSSDSILGELVELAKAHSLEHVAMEVDQRAINKAGACFRESQYYYFILNSHSTPPTF